MKAKNAKEHNNLRRFLKNNGTQAFVVRGKENLSRLPKKWVGPGGDSTSVATLFGVKKMKENGRLSPAKPDERCGRAVFSQWQRGGPPGRPARAAEKQTQRQTWRAARAAFPKKNRSGFRRPNFLTFPYHEKE